MGILLTWDSMKGTVSQAYLEFLFPGMVIYKIPINNSIDNLLPQFFTMIKYTSHIIYSQPFKLCSSDFPGGSGLRICLLMQGTWVQSGPGKLHMPQDSGLYITTTEA